MSLFEVTKDSKRESRELLSIVAKLTFETFAAIGFLSLIMYYPYIFLVLMIVSIVAGLGVSVYHAVGPEKDQ